MNWTYSMMFYGKSNIYPYTKYFLFNDTYNLNECIISLLLEGIVVI